MGRKSRGGFTLIELALSMVFIAILSVTVVLLVQNVSVSYRRGMALNQLNTVGMDLIDDFRISIQNADSNTIDKICDDYYPNNRGQRDKCISDSAASFTLVEPKYADVYIKDADMDEEEKYTKTPVPVYGAFCTGTYTYIWNSGYFEDDEYSDRTVRVGSKEVNPVSLKQGDNKIENFRLIKVYDDKRSICVNAVGGVGSTYKTYEEYYKNHNVPETLVYSGNNLKDNIEYLLEHKAGDLVIYDLYVDVPASPTTRRNLFYAASFVLGTKRGGADIMAKGTGNTCKPPSNDYSELEYCAINRFNFAVMAGGYGNYGK